MKTDDMFQATPVHKLVRKDDPQTSHDAARKVDTKKGKAFIHKCASEAGSDGITSKEIAASHPEIPNSSVTARPKDLERDGLIFYRGDKRDGARIMRLTKYDSGSRLCSCGSVLMKYNDYKCNSPRHK